MSISLPERLTISEMARSLYDFLPGDSFDEVAQRLGLGHLWQGGSKRPAITNLLEKTLETRRDDFCKLILEIVRKGLVYRNCKENPVTRDEIETLNSLISRVQFNIPELRDPSFLDPLPSKQQEEKPTENRANQETLDNLKRRLLELYTLKPQERGYAFEKFLPELFAAFGLAPRESFCLVGEQIDGSFQLGSDTYLVEVKWHNNQTPQADLLIFKEKVEGKATWSRGLFMSYSGFTSEGLQAFARGRSTNIIGMTGQDIHFILDGKMNLVDAISEKARHAAETGEFFVSVDALKRKSVPNQRVQPAP
ncbi:MAG TPA: restriction endonuclease [Verrucomicrobiota bacterium]|nr:MAG: hypothetical protein BWX68_01984 [Verrucomicrobia bacterium ADurb.Bin063]HPO42597.1 restriction endonuclease [Verrucomicrobiota bacterium]